MANATSFPLSFVLAGDGVSLSATVGVSPMPTAVTLMQVQDVLGANVAANVSSVNLVGSTVTLNFTAAFNGNLYVTIALAYPYINNIQQQPVIQVTSPWIVSGTITNFPATVAVTQSTSPWVVSGHVITDVGSVSAVTQTTSPWVVGGTVTVVQPTGTNLHVVNDAGANIIGKVDILGNAGAVLDGPVGGAASANGLWTMTAPSTAAAASCLAKPAAALNVLNVKASAGSVYGCTVANKASLIIYLQFYNTAGVPTLGTGVQWWVPIASGASLQIPPGTFALGNFSTGIGIGAATSATGNGVPPVAPDVTVWYI